MSKIIENYQNKRNLFLSKHSKAKIFTEYLNALLLTLISAFLFAITFKMFQSPEDPQALTLISGGTAGLARTVSLAVLMGLKTNDSTVMTVSYSIAYVVFNIPIIILAFRKIGFRFAIFTTTNIIATSLLNYVVGMIPFVDEVATQVACVIPVEIDNTTCIMLQAGLLARAFLAGVFNGLASALAFGCGSSSGGADTVSYYFSMRKSTNVGRYVISINAVVVGLFAILNTFAQIYNPVSGFIKPEEAVANGIIIVLFVMIYSFISAAVIDLITRNNKKEQIQIVTKNENLAKLLLDKTHHGATIMRSKGAFSNDDFIVIYIIVSTFESKNVVKQIKEIDPKSFVNVIPVKQVYGRFTQPKVK